MPGEQEKFSVVSRSGIPNSRCKDEKFSISRDEVNDLLEDKPQFLSKSMYWSYLIKKGNLMLKQEKNYIATLKQLAEKHNDELVGLLNLDANFIEILQVLERQQKELDEIATASLEEL